MPTNCKASNRWDVELVVVVVHVRLLMLLWPGQALMWNCEVPDRWDVELDGVVVVVRLLILLWPGQALMSNCKASERWNVELDGVVVVVRLLMLLWPGQACYDLDNILILLEALMSDSEVSDRWNVELSDVVVFVRLSAVLSLWSWQVVIWCQQSTRHQTVSVIDIVDVTACLHLALTSLTLWYFCKLCR